jgi:hypothetical protein
MNGVSANIEYDSLKAEKIFSDSSELVSGAVAAFETGKVFALISLACMQPCAGRWMLTSDL